MIITNNYNHSSIYWSPTLYQFFAWPWSPSITHGIDTSPPLFAVIVFTSDFEIGI